MVWCYTCRAAEEPFIASMGIYVIKAEAIKRLLINEFPEVSSIGPCIVPARSVGLRMQPDAERRRARGTSFTWLRAGVQAV